MYFFFLEYTRTQSCAFNITRHKFVLFWVRYMAPSRERENYANTLANGTRDTRKVRQGLEDVTVCFLCVSVPLAMSFHVPLLMLVVSMFSCTCTLFLMLIPNHAEVLRPFYTGFTVAQ